MTTLPTLIQPFAQPLTLAFANPAALSGFFEAALQEPETGDQKLYLASVVAAQHGKPALARALRDAVHLSGSGDTEQRAAHAALIQTLAGHALEDLEDTEQSQPVSNALQTAAEKFGTHLTPRQLSALAVREVSGPSHKKRTTPSEAFRPELSRAGYTAYSAGTRAAASDRVDAAQNEIHPIPVSPMRTLLHAGLATLLAQAQLESNQSKELLGNDDLMRTVLHYLLEATATYPQGFRDLQEAVAEIIYGNHAKARDILPTSAGMRAIERIISVLDPEMGGVVAVAPGFAMYPITSLQHGVRYTPYQQQPGQAVDWNDLKTILDVEDPSFIALDSPANPSGCLHDIELIKKIAEYANQRKAVFLVDTAYGEFLDNWAEYRAAIFEIQKQYPENVIVLGSSSKAEATAGERVGWYVAKKNTAIHEILARLITPFEVSNLGHDLVVTALRDPNSQAEFTKTRTAIRHERRRFEEAVIQLGCVVPWPTQANFTLVVLPENVSDQDVARRLKDDYNIAVRPLGQFQMAGEMKGRSLRITISGDPERNNRIIEALTYILS